MSGTTTTIRTIAPEVIAAGTDTSAAPKLNLRHLLSTQGYAIVPSILSPTELEELRGAASTATQRARAGAWPHIRTLPKQFPPWPAAPGDAGIWGVQHLLHPSLAESAVFKGSYFHRAILASVAEILGLDDDDSAVKAASEEEGEELVMELYNLLVRPERDFALRWHRDDIPPSASADEEREVLGRPITHAQWNLALYDDESLLVVPGSQGRARTDGERAADPHEGEIEGMQVVSIKAGDAVFYDNNILHTGRYSAQKERATLHGSMGVRKGSGERARNVLQHGVGAWVGGCDFSVLTGTWRGRELKDIAEAMRTNLVSMGSGAGMGFSQGMDE